MNKKVSIIMSIYNAEKTLKKSLESIVNQTYEIIEILIADDGSTDNTLKICEEFLSKHENIELLVNKKNIGLTKTLNLLIEKSKGDYIARQDADDISYNYRIAKQLDFLLENNLDVVLSRANIMNQNRMIPGISYYLPKKLLIKLKNPYIHGTLFIKTNVIKKLGGYNEKFYYAQDYKLMTDLHNAQNKIKMMKEPLYELNMENNISNLKLDSQKYFANCVKKGIAPEI